MSKTAIILHMLSEGYKAEDIASVADCTRRFVYTTKSNAKNPRCAAQSAKWMADYRRNNPRKYKDALRRQAESKRRKRELASVPVDDLPIGFLYAGSAIHHPDTRKHWPQKHWRLWTGLAWVPYSQDMQQFLIKAAIEIGNSSLRG